MTHHYSVSSPSLKTPRVLMLLENCSYPRDGRVRKQATSLVEAGYRVSVIAPAARGERFHESVEGVEVYRYRAFSGASFLGYVCEYLWSTIAIFALSLLVLLRRDFDVLHLANPPDSLVVFGILYRLLGKRFIYDNHDLAPEMYELRFQGKSNRLVRRVLLLLERLSCRFADRVITTNESHRQVLATRTGISPQCITVVRNGPLLEQFLVAGGESQMAYDSRTRIVYAGVMGVQDGVDSLLRALHHLRVDLSRDDFVCLLVGDGQARQELQTMVSKLELERYVAFAGWLPDTTSVARELASADICVAPEPSNPYNDCSTVIKILEYMAAGKPVVAFDLPEHRFTAEDSALYVTPNDELEFARALVRLIDDPGLRNSMGKSGRERIERQLDWRYSVPHLLSAYGSLFPALQLIPAEVAAPIRK